MNRMPYGTEDLQPGNRMSHKLDELQFYLDCSLIYQNEEKFHYTFVISNKGQASGFKVVYTFKVFGVSKLLKVVLYQKLQCF